MQSPVAVARLMRIAKANAGREEGQDLLEYGLLAALIAVVAVGAITSLGQTLYSLFWNTIANNF